MWVRTHVPENLIHGCDIFKGILCCFNLRRQGSNLQICFSSRMSLGDSTFSKTSVVDMVCEVASLSPGARFHDVGEKKSSLRA